MNVESFLQGPGPTPEPEQWYSTKTVLLKVNNKSHGLAACGGLFFMPCSVKLIVIANKLAIPYFVSTHWRPIGFAYQPLRASVRTRPTGGTGTGARVVFVLRDGPGLFVYGKQRSNHKGIQGVNTESQ